MPLTFAALLPLAMFASPDEVFLLEDDFRILPIDTNGQFTHTALTRMQAADLSGNHTTDLVFLCGPGQLVYAYEPGRRTSFTPIPVAAVDFATLPGGGPGSADALAVTTATGLSKVVIDYDQDEYFVVSEFALTGWENAEHLAAGESAPNAQGVAPLWLAALASGGDLLIASDVLGAPAGMAYPLPGEAWDLLPIDWDGDGLDELAVVGDFGLRIIDPQTGSECHAWPLVGLGAGFGAAFGQAGFVGERAALMFTPDGTSNAFLYVVDRNGIEAPIDFGVTRPYDMIASDFGQDGDDDLAIAFCDTVLPTMVSILENRSSDQTSPTFDPLHAEGYIAWDAGAVGQDQQAPLVLADFTHDGDTDLALFDEAADEWHFMENAAFDHRELEIDVDFPGSLVGIDKIHKLAHAELMLHKPDQAPAEANGIEIGQWVQYELEGIWKDGQQSFVIDLDQLGPDWNFRPRLKLWQHGITLGLYSQLEIRYVKYTGGLDNGAGVIQGATVDRGWPIKLTTMALYLYRHQELEDYYAEHFGTGSHANYGWEYAPFFWASDLTPSATIPTASTPQESEGFGDVGAGGGPPIPPPADNTDGSNPPKPPGG